MLIRRDGGGSRKVVPGALSEAESAFVSYENHLAAARVPGDEVKLHSYFFRKVMINSPKLNPNLLICTRFMTV
jgi:hypothetical protein